jgi:UDP-2-acetamido-2-deoxy-ribo-hexuluronate aminotransferase
MDTLQCAVVLSKLERFDWEVERRLSLGHRYRELIGRSGASVHLLANRGDRDCIWAQFTLFVDRRDAVQLRLKELGVPTMVHYPRPLHHQAAYAAYCCAECCPESQYAAQRVLSLPMSADLSEAQQARVVAALARAASG